MRSLKHVFLIAIGLVMAGCWSVFSTKSTQRTAKVAVILPLSGDFKNFGGEMQNAINMALVDRPSQLEVQYFDTNGTEQGALAAGHAARDFGADLVLGPLVGRYINVVRQGLGSGPPIISFSNDDTKAQNGHFIFNVTPMNAVESILDYAVQNGRTDIGLLYPDNLLGEASLKAATGTALNLGINIVAAFPYSAESGREGAASRQDAAEQMAELKDQIDALLLPDSGGKLREVATLSFFYEIEPEMVSYLGTHLMDDASLTTEPALKGAYFSGFSEGLALFETRFATRFGGSPQLTSIAAYDAISMIVTLVNTNQSLNIKNLTNPSGFTGVLGTYRLKSNGTTERLMTIKTMTPDGIQVVQPGLQTFRVSR